MDEGQLASLFLPVRLRWCRKQDYYEDNWHGTWKMDGGVITTGHPPLGCVKLDTVL